MEIFLKLVIATILGYIFFSRHLKGKFRIATKVSVNEEVMYDRACVFQNADFICIVTYSGYYGSSLDPQGRQHLLPSDATADAIGIALLDSLSYSRVALPKDAPDLYPDREGMAQQYKEWVDGLMQHYGYKTRRALFKAMKSCTVHRRHGATLTIFPTVQDRLESWAPMPNADNVVISADSTAEEIGAAVQLALSRSSVLKQSIPNLKQSIKSFSNLCYINQLGLSAPVDTSHPDNPYFGITTQARSVLNSDMNSVGWNCGDKFVRVDFSSRVIAALDVGSQLLFVVLHYADTQFKRPRNAVVVDPAGVVLFQIDPPPVVTRMLEMLPNQPPVFGTYPVEYINNVIVMDGRIVLELGFNYEWVERRYYSVKDAAWAERESIYRK